MKIKRIMKICLFTILSFIVINTFTDDVYAIKCEYNLLIGPATYGDVIKITQDKNGNAVLLYQDFCHGGLGACSANWISSVKLTGYEKAGLDRYKCIDFWHDDKHGNNAVREFRIQLQQNIIKCNDGSQCCPVLYGSINTGILAPDLFLYFAHTGDSYKLGLTDYDPQEAKGPTNGIQGAQPCSDDEFQSLITWADTQGNKAGNRFDDALRNAQDKFRNYELTGECPTAEEIDSMINSAEGVMQSERDNFDSRWSNRVKKITCTIDSNQWNEVVATYTTIVEGKFQSYMDFLKSKKNEYLDKGCITDEENEELEKAIEEAEQEAKKLIDEIYSEAEEIRKDMMQRLSGVDCKSLIDQALLDKIQKYMTWIRIIVPILVIVLGTVDFAKAVLIQEKDENSKAFNTFIKRCVVAVIIFFLPNIIALLVHMYNDAIDNVPDGIRLTPMKDCGLK